MKKIIVLLIMLTATQISVAGLSEKLQEKWRWVKFGVQSGLPSDKNVKIIEALDGIIWACTPKGFAWYDGYVWNMVPNKNIEFKVNEINDVEPHIKSGLLIVNNGKIYNVLPDSVVQIKIPKNLTVVEAVAFSKREILIKTVNRKKNLCKLLLLSEYYIKELPSNINSFKNLNARNIIRDNDGIIFLNLPQGLYFWKNNTWIQILKGTNFEPFDLYEPIINKNGEGYLAFGFPHSLRGIWKFSYKNESLKFDHNNSTILSMADINDNDDVIALYIGGLVETIENGNKKRLDGYIDLIDNPSRVFFMSDGNLWISSEQGLFLCKLNNDRWIYYRDKVIFENNLINELVKFNSKIYISSANDLFSLDSLGNYEIIEKPKEMTGITGLNFDSESNMWVSSGNNLPGVFRFRDNKWDFLKLLNDDNLTVHKIRKDRKNNLWFLTLSSKYITSGFGAFQYTDNKFVRWDTAVGLINNRVYDFLEDLSGNYWFATYQGLCKYDGRKWTYWNIKNGLRYNRIIALTLDNSNKVWFSDFYRGIGYVTNDSVKFLDILDDNTVYGAMSLAFDKNNKLWIATNGLYYLNNDAVAYFNKNNGLLKSAVWPLLIEDDKVYVGTAGGGLNILSLKEKNEPLPKIFLQYKGESNSIYHIAWNVYSYWGQMPPEEIQVRYKIDNGEWSNWNLLRELKIDDISYGEHSFTIQAKGLFGDYEGTEKSIVFDVEYPFYFSPFFIAPIIILLAITLGYRHNYNKKKRESIENIKQMNINLNDKVNQQTKQISDALKNLKAEIMIRKQAEEELIIAKNNISKAYYKEKELNVLKSNTFSAISQEFKDPLTIISTSTELLEYYYKQNNESGFKEKISNIMKSITHLFNIIEEIIVVGQFESNRIELEYEKFDLIVLANDIISNYSQHFKTKHGIKIQTEFNEFVVNSDKTFIRHIITNLLSNSIKFSSEGSEIIIEILKINSEFAIKIKDSGIGIPNDYLDKIFEPFIRADNVKNINGTGFGLTVVKRAVELLGGEIICSSVLNEGTIFSLYLPLDKKQI
jgi:signal transduction histidine kinase/ligand-binding sensor domain-containing protein